MISDILSDSESGISSAVGVQRLSREHCRPALAVEVRRGTLPSDTCG